MKECRSSNNSPTTYINFVKAGQSKGRKQTGILAGTTDWELLVDLKKQLKFPVEITDTRLRPDIVIWSKSTKKVIIIELTVPWEENIETAHERKMLKYQDLTDECREKGWKIWCMAIEVGVRGFAGQSIWRCCGTLGIIAKRRKDLIKAAEKHAEEASRWIWNKENWQMRPQQLNVEKAKEPVTHTTIQPQRQPKPLKKWKKQLYPINKDTLFFFGYKMKLSNFYPCRFTVQLPPPYEIKVMHSVEQLYMFRKSYYFNDQTTCKEILKTTTALKCKQLGKEINNFVSEEWAKVSEDVMKECVTRKFTSSTNSEELTRYLLNTPKVLVEASPSDEKWGIGFSKTAGPYILKEDWGDGINLLGKLLMELKRYLVEKQALDANFTDTYNFHTIYRKIHRQQIFTYPNNKYKQMDEPKHEPFITYLQTHKLI